MLNAARFLGVPTKRLIPAMVPEYNRLLSWQTVQKIIVRLAEISDTTFIQYLRVPLICTTPNVCAQLKDSLGARLWLQMKPGSALVRRCRVDRRLRPAIVPKHIQGSIRLWITVGVERIGHERFA